MPKHEGYKWRLVLEPVRLIIRVMGAKMYQNSGILTIQSDSQAVLDQSIQLLSLAGLQVMRSFDLKAARAAHVDCTCPYHGTDQCDCQMVVLLVYGQDPTPATLVFHGHDGQTQIALVDTPELRPSAPLTKAILKAFLPHNDLGWKLVDFSLEERTEAG